MKPELEPFKANIKRRQKLFPKNSDTERLLEASLNYWNPHPENTHSNHVNHPLARMIREPMTLKERIGIIDYFVKKHEDQHKLDRKIVANYALEHMPDGYKEFAPHSFVARLHLLTLLPKNCWTPNDVERLRRMAKALTDRDSNYARYIQASRVNRSDILGIAASLKAKAQDIETAITPKGGNLPPKLKRK